MRTVSLIAAAAATAVVVAGAAASSGARLIAFSRCGPDGCSNGTDVWVIREDGSGLRRLTRHGRQNISPTWSPDGKRLAFSRGDGLSAGIWTLNLATHRAQRLTYSGALDVQPVWSPNGASVVFVREFPGGGSAIEKVVVDRRRVTRLSSARGDYKHPTWSPHGRRIAYAYSPSPKSRHYSIVVVSAEGTGEHEIAGDAIHDYLDPAWSPNGKLIAFSLLAPRRHTFSADLVTMHPDGTRRRIVLRAPSNTVYFSPSWSPDGRVLAFVVLRARAREGRLAFVGVDGHDLRILQNIVSDNRSPVWQPRAAWRQKAGLLLAAPRRMPCSWIPR